MKWYQTTWATILFLIIFAPVGIFLMFKYHSWKLPIKVVCSVIFGCVFLSALRGRGNDTAQFHHSGIKRRAAYISGSPCSGGAIMFLGFSKTLKKWAAFALVSACALPRKMPLGFSLLCSLSSCFKPVGIYLLRAAGFYTLCAWQSGYAVVLSTAPLRVAARKRLLNHELRYKRCNIRCYSSMFPIY